MKITMYPDAEQRSKILTLSWETTKDLVGITAVILSDDDYQQVLLRNEEQQNAHWLEWDISELKANTPYCCQLIKHFLDGTCEEETADFIWQEREFKGKWIAHPQGATGKDNYKPAPIIRKSFMVKDKLKAAELFISGLGFYEFRVNEDKIEDTYLNPPFTAYDQRAMYDIWELTDHLKLGLNQLDIQLGNGWYNSFADDAWNFNKAAWKSQPKVLFDLQLLYEDGTRDVVASGTDCLMGKSAVVFDGLRNGEYFDQTQPAAAWPKISDELFEEKPIIANPPGGYLVPNRMPKIRCQEVLKPVTITQLWDDRFLVDFGKNIAGWCRLLLPESELSSNVDITLRYGEKLSLEGVLDQRDISKFLFSGEYQSDHFCWAGKRVDWHPSYCYHGFQYVEVTGLKELTSEMLEAWFVHTDLNQHSEFRTSDAVLQWLHDAAVNSTVGNYHGIPTDCPQREKNGWTGDVTLSCGQMLRNFDMESAFWKWLQDIKDAQRFSGELPGIVPTSGWGYEFSVGPAWDSVLLELPYQMYQHYGRKNVLRDTFPYMQRYMVHLTNHADDWIIDYGLGDWCAPTLGGNEGDYHCPTAITGTAIFYHCCHMMADICDILNEKGKHEYLYAAKQIRTRFVEKFIDLEKGTIKSETQTAYATALYFNLVDGELKQQFLENLVSKISNNDNHLDCGILGTKYLFSVLFENDFGMLAHKLLTQTTYPSFGYWQSMGATTLFESWKGFHSRNHHMFSSPAEYLLKFIAGIQLTSPGYQSVRIAPVLLDGLTDICASQRTPQGQITVSITGAKDKTISIHLPNNVEAELVLPKGYLTSEGVSVMTLQRENKLKLYKR